MRRPLLARFSAVPSLTSLAPGRASARLFGMVNQLPTVYKALSGDDGKPGAAGAKKKVRLATRRSPGAPLGLASRRRTPRPPDATADARAGALTPVPCGAAAGVPGARAQRRRQARPPGPGGASAGAVASRPDATAAVARRASALSCRRPRHTQCYEKPSPGRILSPKDNLNQLQGATIEVRAAAAPPHARQPAPPTQPPPPPLRWPRTAAVRGRWPTAGVL